MAPFLLPMSRNRLLLPLIIQGFRLPSETSIVFLAEKEQNRIRPGTILGCLIGFCVESNTMRMVGFISFHIPYSAGVCAIGEAKHRTNIVVSINQGTSTGRSLFENMRYYHLILTY